MQPVGSPRCVHAHKGNLAITLYENGTGHFTLGNTTWDAPKPKIIALVNHIVAGLNGKSGSMRRHGPFRVYTARANEGYIGVTVTVTEMFDDDLATFEQLYRNDDFTDLPVMVEALAKHGWWEQEDGR
ncbi:hypothetical protein [Trueperella bialowiezensis]|uniref:Uncharacterized protein n=1 Tax=Trueperella bialowiezensis TaxID=312285 RepID=A0A448PEA6_9ACTO|nr:hypothetical protein [Trueperella bialowiezensis]VEI13230.1 Uncharacterised protein [Trueperella bialowiezensis]